MYSPPINRIESFFGGAKPFQLRLVFLFALLQEPEAFAHNFSDVVKAAEGHADLDERFEMIREIDIAGRPADCVGPPKLSAFAVM
jgi:hypothetical protein